MCDLFNLTHVLPGLSVVYLVCCGYGYGGFLANISVFDKLCARIFSATGNQLRMD